MTFNLTELDAHEQPSDEMRAEFKHFQRLEPDALLHDKRVDDPRRPPEEAGFRTAGSISREQIAEALAHLGPEYESHAKDDAPILFHPILPGLLIVPSLVPPSAQPALLDRMLHRDLSNPDHQTNMHLHYDVPYPPDSQSFFTLSPDTPDLFTPKDPSVHRPLSARQVLQRRLHWLTLGGQYDWTNRVYPPVAPPPFPPDLRAFLEALFPATCAQAAIVNLYTPGDTMMMHRDVSEETDKGLVSLSLGCDGLFMIAPSGRPSPESDGPEGDAAADTKKYLLLRLRSGDAIYMTQEARYAWHGVPKVVKDTCPAHLASWPATEDGSFGDWEGWMRNKRINLNVRQMRD